MIIKKLSIYPSYPLVWFVASDKIDEREAAIELLKQADGEEEEEKR